MQAVGRIGSYISRSVYTVSAPFHPFGGAVDIIVVEQPDGTYKSSPWYVRFGKFQGVLKSKEKVVSINVNGVEADFHMYLNHKGEAYFLKEIDEEDDDSAYSPPSSSGEDNDKVTNRRPLKSISCNCDPNWPEKEKNAVAKTNSGPSQIFGFVFGRKSTNDENESGVIRTESLERAEIAADLLDLKWSTNLVSPKRKKDNNNTSRLSAADKSKDEVNGNLAVDGENGVGMKCVTEKVIVETATSVESVGEVTTFLNSETEKSSFAESEFQVTSASVISEVAKSDAQTQDSVEKLKRDQFTLIHEERVSINGSASESIVTEYSQLVSIQQSDNSIKDIDSQSHATTSNLSYVEEIYDNQESRISEEEQLLFGNLYDFVLADHEEKKADISFSSRDADGVNESSDAKCCSSFSLDQSVLDDYINDVDPQRRRLRSISSESCIKETGDEDLTRMARSLPIIGPLSKNLEASDKHKSPGAQTTSEDVKIIQERKARRANPSTGIPPRPIDSQRSWPFSFHRSRSMKASRVEANGIDNPNTTEVPNNSSDLEGMKDVTKEKESKKTLRTLTPTSEQLASLNLKEGKNIVVFTFQTGMLGKQQVDARIFMWRWDTRIVISDVDGTITRSDLLGQVMPLVGMDWSQTGVAHLFSAIKENGYQLLFLSARSIAQSFITRQFLFNIKQDGKALPEGPVVISPDGLFPSLFREVVRRAPHEFKIACLEDIKALFPADTNPFYAGFGNRDTDEFSYLKVGIPRGKIFIINPKGEIVVNRRVDTKSYLSLHALVHGMFPTVSSSEQEDYNSWNYWKLPPPIIDL